MRGWSVSFDHLKREVVVRLSLGNMGRKGGTVGERLRDQQFSPQLGGDDCHWFSCPQASQGSPCICPWLRGDQDSQGAPHPRRNKAAPPRLTPVPNGTPFRICESRFPASAKIMPRSLLFVATWLQLSVSRLSRTKFPSVGSPFLFSMLAACSAADLEVTPE
jgi:hypothetical protein